ncbi:putative GTPase activating protein of Rab-like GTPase [Trypanosoma cruzi]|uniref:Putative GTPase activating protein of Rab-like GTPase n=1 Tax=Trypanosoma cruzi TaxID=5693 RepID=A0A2V2VMN0_TRYCR|nr:putative GTPase activating protein of Rab-like GTPase [Trypanosoma cruzi]
MVQFPPPSLIEELPAVSDPLPQCISHEATDAYFAAIAGPIVSLPVVSGLCRGGATENVRAFFWKLLLGFLPTETSRWAPLLERKALEYREIVSIVCCLDEKGMLSLGIAVTVRWILTFPARCLPCTFLSLGSPPRQIMVFTLLFRQRNKVCGASFTPLPASTRDLGTCRG